MSLAFSVRKHIKDYYPTPSFVTEALLSVEKFRGEIWEPACGSGDMSCILKTHYKHVRESDIREDVSGLGGVDFLTSGRITDNIITNPPFILSDDFIYKAKTSAKKKIAFLLPLRYLESKKRKSLWVDKSFPLKTVHVFSDRITFKAPHVEGNVRGLIPFAWFVWDKAHGGAATLNWL